MNSMTRAWKDPVFRATLDETDLAMLPDSPVGQLVDIGSELAQVVGGDHAPTHRAWTFCTCFTCNWSGCNRATVDCTWPFC